MLQNLAWTKATVNGKKAALVVFNDSVWLLSYVVAWDRPETAGYSLVPNHSFHKKRILAPLRSLDSFAEWRTVFLGSSCAGDIVSIALPGEPGYDREVHRRTNRRTAANSTATQTTESAEAQTEQSAPCVQSEERRPEIDFYLPNYTHDRIYRGRNSYHASHAHGFMNQPRNSFSGHRIGIELEVEATNDDNFCTITSCSSNWFTRESDASLGDYGVEFITIPLLPDDAKSYATWQPLCNYLKQKAKSWDTGGRCGLHVHIGREILGETENERQITLGKLLIFYQKDVEDWVKATAVFGRQRCYHQPDGNTEELRAVKVLGETVLKDEEVFNKVDRAMKTKFSASRYYAINLHNGATIEFRKGRGSINPDRIIAVITMTEAIVLFAKEHEPADLSLENFKEWLFLNVPCGNPLFRYLDIRQADC